MYVYYRHIKGRRKNKQFPKSNPKIATDKIVVNFSPPNFPSVSVMLEWKLMSLIRLHQNENLWWVRRLHEAVGNLSWVPSTWLVSFLIILGPTYLSSCLRAMSDAYLLCSYLGALIFWTHVHAACQLVPISSVCGCSGLLVSLGLPSSCMVIMDSEGREWCGKAEQ